MTREEYLNERNRLLAEMRAAIDAGDTDTATARGHEVEELDARFQAEATARANYNALADRQPVNFVAAAGAQPQVPMEGRNQQQAPVTDPYDTEEYRNQFMNYVLGRGPAPVITNAAVNGPTTTSDGSAVIPTTTLNEIVKQLKERGVIFSGPDSPAPISVPARQVPVADTTAAGDTFTGYYLAALSRGRTEREALERATAAAAICVSRRGAAPSVPTAREVDAYLAGGPLPPGP